MSNIDPTAFCWYHSDTQLGLMYLGVEISEAEQTNLQGEHRVFQQAALLANTEVMLQAIELWQEIDLDLVPCEAPGNTSLHLSLQLQDNANTDGNANRTALVATTENQVETDDSAAAGGTVESAGEPPETGEQTANEAGARPESPAQSNAELQSVLSVTSSSVDLRVQLDQFSITSEELAVLDTGAVVVIPAAYQPNWEIVAISDSPDVPLRFQGNAKQSDQSLQVQFAHHEAISSNHKDSSDVDLLDESSNDYVTVWCKQQCSVPIKELLGVDTAAQTTQLHSLDVRELHIMQGESTIANGSLLAYGRGSVVAVSERLVD